MFKERTFVIVLFCSVLTVSTVVLQYLNPAQGFLDGGLIAAILLTMFIKDDLYTKLFGIVSLIFIIIESFFPSENTSKWQVILQHLFPAIIVVITTLSVMYIKRLYLSMESEERQLNALFEFATEGIILTNKDGKIVLANPAVTNLFKYDKQDLIGKPIEILIPTRFHHNHGSHRESFYNNPSNRSMGRGRDLFGITKNGTEIPLEVSLSYYKQKGEFFVIAFVVDITQRKRQEATLLEQNNKLEQISATIKKLNIELEDKVEQRTLILKEALQQLEVSQQELSEALQKEKELSEIKSRFVSMASHEFRTPLSTVLSSAALIGRYTKEEEQINRDKHIKKIKESVKHLNDLLEDFLSLGKLLSNAIKFSNEKGIILLTINNNSHLLNIIVKDSGIGISEEDQTHLFSSFYRGSNATNIQGTGLGLHIVKRYTDILQGSIELKSKIGEGTLITVELPKLSF